MGPACTVVSTCGAPVLCLEAEIRKAQVPARVVVEENEEVDQMAKLSLGRDTAELKGALWSSVHTPAQWVAVMHHLSFITNRQ
ncbi:hypothetical protein AAFF_G00065520 [Aldrovandia affinis]|uniref:Uncharacterized protein n=1 Tax=Aldrovandia affinis TaxID=143900 RepID=A0AAD7WZK7_9TELE|nr:hypothetical protein AAFF_G00065520 [Aldrovandia affinis]